MNLEKELYVAKKAAIKAGEKIMEIYNRDFSIDYKDDKSPLTEADSKANEIIIDYIKEFEEYAILSEEVKDDKKRLTYDFCWIVDPLDGTKEFIKRNGQFTVNIALAYKQRPVLGVIYVPVTKELYYAIKDKGAFIEDLETNQIKKLNVTDKTKELVLVGSKSHASDKLKQLIEDNKEKITDIQSAGSSLKGCMVAKGQADIYYRFGYTCEWDTAAMQCITEEAGAIFRQMDHSEMLYNRENNLNEKGFYIVNKNENILV